MNLRSTSLSTNHNNLHITHLSYDKKNSFIDSEAAVLIWKQLLAKGHPKAKNKLNLALEKYQTLCLEYSVSPRIQHASLAT
jgi:hypothetical protein